MTILKSDKKAGGAKSKGVVSGSNNDPHGVHHHQFTETTQSSSQRQQPTHSDCVIPGPSRASFRHNVSLQYAGSTGSSFSRRERSRDNLTNVLATESKSVQGKRLQPPSDSSSKRRKSLLVEPHTEPNSEQEQSSVSDTCVTQSSKNAVPESSDEKGCNSEDEYESRSQESMTVEEKHARELRFAAKMSKNGLEIKLMGEDGACLFRAIADQVYGDQEMHGVVRNRCMDYIAKNRDYFSQYITEDFNEYIKRKSLHFVHGNHIEIQAISEMYNRTVEVYCYGSKPINIFHRTPPDQAGYTPFRLSYHRGTHYNSLIDPKHPTVGVGLGLPGLVPGLADRNMLEEATKRNEDVNIEQAMLEDKLRATDWEATDEAINEEVARESYLQYLRENEGSKRRGRQSPEASTSASSSTRSTTPRRELKDSSEQSFPVTKVTIPASEYSEQQKQNLDPPSPSEQEAKLSQTLELAESLTFVTQLPPDLFGVDKWDDSQGIMAQVLAASQQEYLDHLKSQQQQSHPHKD